MATTEGEKAPGSTSVLSIKLPKLYYATGDTVNGRVLLDLKTDRRVNSIVIHLTGSEFCETSVLADIPFQRKWILDGATTLYGNKIKMNRNGTIQRVGIPPESQAVLIKAGSYSWPFSFAIPKNIPPSALYKNGKVKIGYLLHVVVDVPWSKSMRVAENIRVGVPYYVDLEKAPIIHRNEKKFVIHHRHTAEGNALLKLDASVDKPVTFTGDKLSINVNLENFSGRTVYSLKCKLKQIWVFGSGFFEKSTVAKIKHKDKKFPLESGKFSGVINLIVPNCDLKPTIQNATLIRSSYHLTVLAVVRTSPVRVRIPIVMGSFPPVNKAKGELKDSSLVEAPTTYISKEEQIADMSQNIEQEVSSEPILIDWDAPVPAQFESKSDFEQPLVPTLVPAQSYPQFQYNAPNLNLGLGLREAQQPAPVGSFPALQPVQPAVYVPPSSFALSPPLLATTLSPKPSVDIKPSEKQLHLFSFEKSLRDIRECGAEFDSAAQWSAYLDEDMAVSNATGSLTASVATLASMTRSISATSGQIEKSSVAKLEAPFVVDLESLAVYLRELVNAAKVAAHQIGDSKDQQRLLASAKKITTASQEQAEVAKELIEHNPFSAAFSEESLRRLLGEKSASVRDACDQLVNFSQSASQAAADRVKFLRAKAVEIDAALEEANNPFASVNTGATVEDVERYAQQLSSASSLLVMASHGQYSKVEEAVERTLPLLRALFGGVKGLQSTATRFPESTTPMFDHSKNLAKHLRTLIATITNAVEQGSLNHPVQMERQINEAARDVQGQTSKIVEQTRSIKSKQARYAEEEQREKSAQARRQKEAAEEAERQRQEQAQRQQQALAAAAAASLPPPIDLQAQAAAKARAEAEIQAKARLDADAARAAQQASQQSQNAANSGPVDFDTVTNDGLKSAMAALAAATAKLKTVKGGSPAELRRKALKRSGIHSTKEGLDPKVLVMNATGDVATALRNLLNAARMAQDQRVENNRTGVNKDEVYHKDPTWSEGVVSAAKSVVGTMEQLIEASTNKDLDDDLVITLAKSVTASTAQLVAAERVRGDPDSDATKFLLMSAKGVAAATTELISKTREASQVQPFSANKPMEEKATDKKTLNEGGAQTSDKVKELETALRITRLEKELLAARSDLVGLRRDKYQ